MSLWNFVKYNVVGGGSSALYGVEPYTFYLKNGAVQMQVVMGLFLLMPLATAARAAAGTIIEAFNTKLKGRRRKGAISVDPVFNTDRALLVYATSPAYIWLLAISLLPHKEERFLYVVYPLVSLRGVIFLLGVGETV
jgi:alpha-1,2-mannosyltransferase